MPAHASCCGLKIHGELRVEVLVLVEEGRNRAAIGVADLVDPLSARKRSALSRTWSSRRLWSAAASFAPCGSQGRRSAASACICALPLAQERQESRAPGSRRCPRRGAASLHPATGGKGQVEEAPLEIAWRPAPGGSRDRRAGGHCARRAACASPSRGRARRRRR